MGDEMAELLGRGAADAIAISTPPSEAAGRPPLTHGALRDLARATAQALASHGVGRGDRLAIVLPNGPEMAAAFVTVAWGATTAPLNPAYRAEEFDFYLGDLGAGAILLAAGTDGPAAAVARARGLPVLRLTPSDAATGAFTIEAEGATGRPSRDPGPAGADDVALILHTSGTTSRPKIVPLSQRNLAASARHIGRALALVPGDRCLNMMPLFHIHGLIAAVTSSLAAGAEVCCAPGFDALKAFRWLDESRPTWFTAVPTMHQALLARAERNQAILDRLRLRLIRSSSASLPPQVMTALEAAFGCPVIESYGMTEATHQMASNPLPPGARKPGSVGVAAGPEVAIMDPEGRLLAAGVDGEVVIRGPNVTTGYENNPKANAEGFTAGWFRTGDQGHLDDEGYLWLTGRLKEMINRGGEKVSPLEVDTVLMDHPAVAQVVTFAMPHPKLGEEVAAVVVTREGVSVSERELRDFVAGRLADFKVPRKILFMDEIPKGATGKLQRIGLAAKLGLAG
jgi:acyl-CoA synthetase (AMP-forming)/AMP-acid ligase II